MMNDCENIEVREALPELMLGTLPEAERVRVQQHLDACDDCSAELAIIRAVRASAVMPAVNVERIVAAIPPYRRKRTSMRRVYLELAAACLIGAVGISTFALHNSGHSATPAANGAAAAASMNVNVVASCNPAPQSRRRNERARATPGDDGRGMPRSSGNVVGMRSKPQ